MPTRDEADKEILYISISHDEKLIGVCVGRHGIREDDIEITELVIYSRRSTEEEFSLTKVCAFDNKDAGICFAFNRRNTDELLFATRRNIFAFDWSDEGAEERDIIVYEHPLVAHNIIRLVLNDNQDRAVVVTELDAVYYELPVDGQRQSEIDLDDQEGISTIKNVVCDNDAIYILANKHEGKVGIYLLKLEMKDPTKSTYMIKYNNKLDIDDCDLYIMTEGEGKTQSKSLVMCYKLAGFNTFNVVVIGMQKDESGEYLIKYWHESNQLWESPVKGFLLSSNDFLVISKDGINMLALGN